MIQSLSLNAHLDFLFSAAEVQKEDQRHSTNATGLSRTGHLPTKGLTPEAHQTSQQPGTFREKLGLLAM